MLNSFPHILPAEYQTRASRLLEYARDHQLDGIVLFDAFHIQYLTGSALFPTERPIAFAMSLEGVRGLLVPRLEWEHAQAQAESTVEEFVSYPEYPGDPHPMLHLKDLLARLGIRGRIGVDANGYPPAFGYVGPSLSSLAGDEVVIIYPFVDRLMMVKSATEIELLRESAKWCNLAHRLLQKYTRAGARETEVSLRATAEATLAVMEALGPNYHAKSLEPGSNGPRVFYRGQIGRSAALPHAQASNVEFLAGDVLVSGTHCPMWGYDTELERTMFIGEPSRDQKRFFFHMKALQETAFDALKPGVRCADVDSAVHAYYEKNDLVPYWRHHTGHGLGLRSHEAPFLDTGDSTVLEPGMVLSVEPGLYVPGLGGFRNSDSALITDHGMELLTDYPRELADLILPV